MRQRFNCSKKGCIHPAVNGICILLWPQGVAYGQPARILINFQVCAAHSLNLSAADVLVGPIWHVVSEQFKRRYDCDPDLNSADIQLRRIEY